MEIRTKGWSSMKRKRTKLRHEESTAAEVLLWERLKGKKIQGQRFRRQHGIEPYIADFYHAGSMTVIEIDGNIHDDEEVKYHDEVREEYLKERGYKILRIRNEEVYNDLDSVLEKILSVVTLSPFQGGWGVKKS